MKRASTQSPEGPPKAEEGAQKDTIWMTWRPRWGNTLIACRAARQVIRKTQQINEASIETTPGRAPQDRGQCLKRYSLNDMTSTLEQYFNRLPGASAGDKKNAKKQWSEHRHKARKGPPRPRKVPKTTQFKRHSVVSNLGIPNVVWCQCNLTSEEKHMGEICEYINKPI